MQQQNKNLRQIAKKINFPERRFPSPTFQDKLIISAVSSRLCPIGHP
jgi:hypothetical protein